MADINVFNPQGKAVSIDESQYGAALKQGYSPATPEQIQQSQLQETHGTLPQQAIAGLEAAGRGASFGLSTKLETLAGVSPEDIQKREEANPATAVLGEAAGLIGSTALGVGEGAAVAKLGEMAGASISSKVGSLAARMAAENALVQSGNEAHKMLLDPHQSVETSIANVGLAALLGGGLGAGAGVVAKGANKLWELSSGSKLGKVLEQLKSATNGEPVKSVPDDLNALIHQIAPDASPEIKAAISGDADLANKWQMLRESQSKAGIETKQNLDKFISDAKDSITQKMGLTTEQLNSFPNVSESEVGNKIKNSLVDSIKQKYSPINDAYKDIESKFNKVELALDDKKAISDALGKASLENKYYIDPESTGAKVIEKFNKSLDNIKTIEDFRVHKSNVLNPLFANPENRNIAGALSKSLNEVEGSLIDKSFGSPELADYLHLKDQYKQAKNFVNELSGRLSLGKVGGEKGILGAMDLKLDGEDFLKRLNPSNSVELNNFLSRELPDVQRQVLDYHKMKLLDKALDKGGQLNPEKLQGIIENLSPEFRASLFNKEQLTHIDAVGALLNKLPTRLNPSGTAGVLEKLTKGSVSTVGAIAGGLPGWAIGKIGEHVQSEALPGLQLSLLKFLGSNGAVDSVGFNAMSKYISAVQKSEKVFSTGIKALISGGEVLSSKMIPSKKEIDTLRQHVEELSQNPQKMLDVTHHAASYMPDHADAASMTSMAAISYLSHIRPQTLKTSPLDRPQEPTQSQKSEFNKQLEIAQQPAMIMQHIKDGTLTPKEMVTFKTIYPNLYQNMVGKIMDNLAENPEVPYKQRLGLSLFLGQPLDSTMSPIAMSTIQGGFQARNQAMQAPAQMNKIKNIHKNEQSSTDKIERP